jgi:hypothetical protein
VTALTVWGTAARVDETAAHYDEWGRLTSAHSVKEFDLGLPDDPIRVTFRHDPALEIGDLAEYEGRVLLIRLHRLRSRNIVKRDALHRAARLDHWSSVTRRRPFRSQSQPAQDAGGNLRRSIDRTRSAGAGEIRPAARNVRSNRSPA